MTDTSSHLALPFMAAAQAQKHVTHNEALLILDAVVQIGVIDRHLTAPPPSPAQGDRYIVGDGARGEWAGRDRQLAAWAAGEWLFYAPHEGWLAWIAGEEVLCAWNGSAWILAGGGGAQQNVPMLGINAAADETSRLVVKSDASLFDHAGRGHQHKINKATGADTASMVFQTGYSGRAEIGLAGNDDLHVKVSPNGLSWSSALVIDRATGVTKLEGLAHRPTGAALALPMFTPGGDGAVSLYRVDAASGQNPRTATISAVSGDLVTLGTGVADLFIADIMTNVVLVRIWNTSKAPMQAAWVKARPAGNQLRVTAAAQIAGWAAGETVQVGDPTSVIASRVITLDISPMLTALFGQAFPQKGIMVKGSIAGSTGDAIALTPTGAGGSFVNCAMQGAGDGVSIIGCTDLSPVSSSNLVRVRETIATTGTTRILSAVAVFV